MILKIIFSYIRGYLNVSVEGYYIERFINICKNENILIWNIKRKENILLFFNVCLSDFKKIRKIAKKTNCRIDIISKKGLPFIINKYKKRKSFLVILIIVVFCLWLSSIYVWNVEIQVENNKKLENIKDDLEKEGLKTGIMKNKINSNEIINKIRLKRDDIAWIGIELKGTNAIVKIVKAEKKPEIIDEDEYCSIVSDKTGVITKINAQNGTANVKIGDIVEKGDVLINGWMEGKYTGIRYVHAKGEIEAKIFYTKNIKIRYNAEKTRKTGNIEKTYKIKLNKFEINFLKKYSKFKNYDTIETDNKIKIFSNFYLPILIQKVIYEEKENYIQNYTKEEAKRIGAEELEKLLNDEVKEKGKIVNKNINTYENEDGIDVYVTYEVIENIGTNEKIVF